MKKDYNSTKNQEIKGKLISREVMCCASQMIGQIQETELSEEVMELFYSTPDYEQAVENYLYGLSEEEKAELCDEYDVDEVEDIDAAELCNDKNIEYDYLEPYEFWIVTDYFGERLKQHGQIVVDFLGFTIWGRLTTGQAILLDHVVSVIAEEMEILEGMSNEW